jgi:hypothetical protein
MESLKMYADRLGTILGTSPAALYERQRALVRARMLGGEAGRGPGSGVRATPRSVSSLLIAFLAADNLSDVDRRVSEILNSSPERAKKCPFTAQATFRDAVATILSDVSLATRAVEVTVSRTDQRAAIEFKGLKTNWTKYSRFVGTSVAKMPILRVEATLERAAIRVIAADLMHMVNRRTIRE